MKLLFLLVLVVMSGRLLAEDKDTPPEAERSRVVTISWDALNMWWPQLHAAHQEGEPDAESVKKILQESVDAHAIAKIDRIVNVVFERFETMVPNFKTATFIGQRLPTLGLPGFKRFHDAGMNQVQIILDRCHEQKIAFLAGLRMNDRHPLSRKAKFYLENPSWHLDEFPGGMDYKHEEVRQAVLAFVKELLEQHDVDGIEFDYMRSCHVFSSSEAVENTPLLTTFMRETRKHLDEAAKKRSRERLLLGVRIPQTIDECTALGFDLATWCQEGLVDYLCPSDFLYTDFNIQVEDFVRMTEGTECKVYPTVHTLVAQNHDDRLMQPVHYRAAANNYYAFGANGISAYNFMYHWNAMRSPAYPGPASMWPKALGYLTELRDPKQLQQEERHYLYYSLRGNNPRPSGAVHAQMVIVKRDSDEHHGQMTFRMAEDLAAPNVSAVLQFKTSGMVPDDQFEIRINDTTVAANRITRHDVVEDQSEEGSLLPAFYLVQVDLPSLPATSGDNQLGVRLTHSAGIDDIAIQELEVIVRVATPPPTTEHVEDTKV